MSSCGCTNAPNILSKPNKVNTAFLLIFYGYDSFLFRIYRLPAAQPPLLLSKGL